MMQDFIDREKAIEEINMLLREQITPWMVLSGGNKIGKTEFAKKIVCMNTGTILCDPTFETLYACAFSKSLYFANNTKIEILIQDYAKHDTYAQKIYNSLGMKYVSILKKSQLSSMINLLIKNDISSGLYSFAHYLGANLEPSVKCIFLDDFHLCDFDSYSWILEFWNALQSPLPTIVVICNFEINWESNRLFNVFHGVSAPIKIEKFDSELAFCDIIKKNFVFENDFNLYNVAQHIFTLFQGSSRLIFETIELLKGKMDLPTDEEKIAQIIKMAYQIKLNRFEDLNKTHMLVVRLLAFCPTPVSKQFIINTLDLVEPLATDIISKLYNDNFLSQIANKYTGTTMYCVRDNFLVELIKSDCNTNEQLFYKTKVFYAIQGELIRTNLEELVNLAIELNDIESENLILQYITKPDNEVPTEKKVKYIDKFLRKLECVPCFLVRTDIARVLYSFGYYVSAQKIMNEIVVNNDFKDYRNLLLLGDIQHVLLLPEASNTYLKASNIPGIAISDKLKAINRQIMALNQEHQEALAKDLYKKTFAQYESMCCTGLIELYRNSNNSFDYEAAMTYTIKGYFLAKELGDELEMYKCLHNICMIRLQYGRYKQPLEGNPLGFEPKFEQVLTFFARHPEYRHEQAYPLLDLGTIKMFEYIDDRNVNYLAAAKKYYSEAQLYARSFYARYIAETGLLIVNSYLYATQHSKFVKSSRIKLYSRYTSQSKTIEDHRVHRKILLSLAVSAVISDEYEEAKNYLKQAEPYITGPETNRYNKLCKKVDCIECIKEPVSLKGKYKAYYSSDEFVPWLISLCH